MSRDDSGDRHDDRAGDGDGAGSDESAPSIPELELDVARTREEFARTLDAIEDKLSVPAHARRLRDSVSRRWHDDPRPVVAAGVAGVVGLASVVAGVVRIARR
ncbi:DUF3618 domain-containing protein [Frigoribacterium sp. NBH87]|uniref:DUF3618 domain-containing protein n=1 Tax=Frigoribacterium sp. NBH87 TaxID=2596916 RepID=UPI0016258E66|nr:DUF3618 domain-containing protein [Frigoribacterium sp. NBH87]QNE44124.1 DUF3618 domain-containing protein [Frigoribacterium sp. NBH87]